ncbi:MAG: RagB/SusD family nutrient uptake outer membrane protein, partial [Chitinophagaceae bacterium]
MKRFNKLFLSKIAGLGLLTGMLLPTSCNKEFLDVDPQGKQPSQQFWQTQNDAVLAKNAMYGNLRGWTNTAFAPIAVESMGSDEAEKGSTPGDAAFHNNYDNFSHTATEGQTLDFWKGQYQN